MIPKRTPIPTSRDTPETRKCRLQDRLKEISECGERELAHIMQTIEKLKRSLQHPKQ